MIKKRQICLLRAQLQQLTSAPRADRYARETSDTTMISRSESESTPCVGFAPARAAFAAAAALTAATNDAFLAAHAADAKAVEVGAAECAEDINFAEDFERLMHGGFSIRPPVCLLVFRPSVHPPARPPVHPSVHLLYHQKHAWLLG